MTQPATVTIDSRLGPLTTIAELHGPLAIVPDFSINDDDTVTLYEGLVTIVHRTTRRRVSEEPVCITCARRLTAQILRLPGWHTINTVKDFGDWVNHRLTGDEKRIWADFRAAELACDAVPCPYDDARDANA